MHQITVLTRESGRSHFVVLFAARVLFLRRLGLLLERRSVWVLGLLGAPLLVLLQTHAVAFGLLNRQPLLHRGWQHIRIVVHVRDTSVINKQQSVRPQQQHRSSKPPYPTTLVSPSRLKKDELSLSPEPLGGA